MHVRLLRDGETEVVSHLVAAAYARDFDLTPDYLAEIADVGSRAREAQVWVARDDGTAAVLGTVTTPRTGLTISPLAREGELDFRFLGVAPEARGRGVGELLVRHVLGLAASRGIRRVVLNTSPIMRSAQRLYERLGFQRLPEREYVFERSDGGSFLMMAYGIDVTRDSPLRP